MRRLTMPWRMAVWFDRTQPMRNAWRMSRSLRPRVALTNLPRRVLKGGRLRRNLAIMNIIISMAIAYVA